MRINVALLGFDGDGGHRYVLDTERFKKLLEDSLPEHQPFIVDTQSKLNANFVFEYNIKKMPVTTYVVIKVVYLYK
jgi:hypothetical protein